MQPGIDETPAITLGRVLFRVDCSPEIGLGHTMRCITLALACQRAGFSVEFIMCETLPAIANLLANYGIQNRILHTSRGSLEDVYLSRSYAMENKALWLVLDGYCFDSEYQTQIRDSAKFRTLVIDDYAHLDRYNANLLLNPNAYATTDLYKDKCALDRVVCGPEYFLLRPAYLSATDQEQPVVKKTDIVISLGGAFSTENLIRVIAALKELNREDLRVVVITGANEIPSTAIRSEQTYNLELVPFSLDLVNQFRSAKIAICAGGATLWELGYLSIPCLVLITAENQRLSASAAESIGFAKVIGDAVSFDRPLLLKQLQQLLDSPDQASRMGQLGKAAINANGADLVASVLKQTSLEIRRATIDDCDLLLTWANDPFARSMFFSASAIERSDHLRWFSMALSSHSHIIYVAEIGGTTIGVVRFELSGDTATISVNLSALFRGFGLGWHLIKKGCESCFQEASAIGRIEALVKPNNEGSLRSFVRAGFRESGLVKHNGQPAIRFELSRDNLGS